MDKPEMKRLKKSFLVTLAFLLLAMLLVYPWEIHGLGIFRAIGIVFSIAAAVSGFILSAAFWPRWRWGLRWLILTIAAGSLALLVLLWAIVISR